MRLRRWWQMLRQGLLLADTVAKSGAKNIFAAHRLKDANPVKDVPSKICGTASAA